MPSTDPTATPTPAQDPSRAAPPEPTSTAPEHQEQPAEVRDLSARLTATQQERDVAVARTRELESEVTRLTGEVARLAPLADVGTQYRTDLIAEALAEGVRAVGSEFAEETYRALLQGASLEVIKRMRDDWQATASRMFTPGRRTVDSAAPSAPADPTDRTPPQAYQ